jgi:hypothetical protein
MKTGFIVIVALLFAVLGVHVIGFTYAQTQTITIDNAVQLFKDYLTRLGNPDLALHEVEEYQNNFYASYFEKSTGIFAFQMIIWKPGSIWTGGMMGNGMMAGVVMPEPGPNMMWNTKYGVMGGMMGIYRQNRPGNMTVTAEQAKALAQQYLDGNFPGETAGDADTYYGYYNIDVLKGGSPFGMLSVNGYSGQVWYHGWHGAYIQTVTVSEVTPVPEFQYTTLALTLGLVLASIFFQPARLSSQNNRGHTEQMLPSSAEPDSSV